MSLEGGWVNPSALLTPAQILAPGAPRPSRGVGSTTANFRSVYVTGELQLGLFYPRVFHDSNEVNITLPTLDFAKTAHRPPARFEDEVGGDSQTASKPGNGRSLGEGRQYFRASRKVRWPVDFQVIGSGPEIDPGRHKAETRGVSLGGAFIAHPHPPGVESDLHLWLYPHEPAVGRGSALRLRAQVRWINATPGALPVGFGVQFRALTAADEVILHSSFSRSAKVV